MCRSVIFARSCFCGSFTLTMSSASFHGSPMRAPAFSYAASAAPMPAPAFVSTTTWCPSATSSRTEVGVRPTRYSCVLTSFGTPMITRISSSLSRLGERFDQRGLLTELELCDLVAVHLIRAVGEAQRARVRIGIGETEIVGHAAAAVHLHRPVDHLERDVRRQHLDHRDLLLGDFVAHGVHLPGGVQHHEARAVDHDARLRDALARHALVGDRAAEGDALGGALAHLLERALGLADEAHAMVDAARPEAALRDLEAAAFAG